MIAVASTRQTPPSTNGVWVATGPSLKEVVLNSVNGRIEYRFHARDLPLVLGPGPGGKPVRFKVTSDGVAPGHDHGTMSAQMAAA